MKAGRVAAAVAVSVVAGPGAPGGSVNRYLLFMITGALAAVCFGAVGAVWRWARRREES